ncbi:4-amino-4-deoxy-L-arabinose transferase-like glycosyltransferase [Ciceribacter lividus]|uniref:4-amino-4-deoxy-L-arabinose transferase-like glycosyltransferase n=1 Tax=Ciceribacter lividus TaxID=1197950 RepID=A0A6I7HPM6_9HYPH|nr:glycosyltransferase family 39 protein [Ciceribacter lividus]RCW27563.1 4-amino-4-deoxy-L-arabinose transferase-like glycosyltransferase [Ciceribacter lividus]
MREAGSGSRALGVILVAVAGYYLLAILHRSTLPPSLEVDESELVYISQFLALGYGRQPPLYDWLQHGMISAFGLSIAVLSVLKNLLLFLTAFFYGLAAREVLRSGTLQAVAVVGILTFPSIFLMSQRDLSHTVAAILAAALFLHAFFLTLKRPSLGTYLYAGVAVAMGLLSKYNFTLLPLAAILAVLPEAEYRKRILDWRMAVAIAIAALLVLPHALWFLQNLDLATGGTMREMREIEAGSRFLRALIGLAALAFALLRGIAPLLLLFGLVFRHDLGAILRASSPWTRIVGRMLLILFAILAVIVVTLDATSIREKWLVLYLLPLPLYLALKAEAAGVSLDGRLKTFAVPVFAVSVATLAYLFLGPMIGPRIGAYTRFNAPIGPFYDAVVDERGAAPALVIGGDKQIAGSLRLNAPEAVVAMPHAPVELPPSAFEKRPALVVWRSPKGDMTPVPPVLVDLLTKSGLVAGGEDLRPSYRAVPYHYAADGDTFEFGYAWLD